jgi:hypothetical protein
MTDDLIYPARKLVEQDGILYENYYEDMNPFLKHAKYMREETDMHKRRKSDMWKVASIPWSIYIEIKTKHGFDLLKDRDEKKMMEILNVHYPYLKTM